MRSPPSAAGWSFTRARRASPRIRAAGTCFRVSPKKKSIISSTLEARYKRLLEQDPQLESRPTFLFFKGAANGLFSRGADELLREGINDLEAYRIGIRCERGSHRFFKRYGERFEDSEGKQVFLEFAEEERDHLEMLIREYRALTRRQRKSKAPPRRGSRASGQRRARSLIDLHMHTTASDGLLAPSELVARASAAGLTTISVTDHDTLAALADIERHASAAGMTLVPGIEVTSVHEQRDVHLLGYFIDASDPGFARFLETQRRQREDRAREIAATLAKLGVPIEVEPLIAAIAQLPGVSIGRPVIARALIDAGHVRDLQEAFDRFLAAGQPAFVPRQGRKPAEVVEAIHAAGGLASLAHPGVTRQPALIEPLARAGLDAIEAYHSDHTDVMRGQALADAKRLNLAVTGGSDHHGEAGRRPLGGVTLPRDEFEAFARRVSR